MINNKVRTSIYINLEMKEKAKELFKHYGLSLSDAFNIFLTKSVDTQGIPFDIKRPTKELESSINELKNNKTTPYSLDELKNDLNL